MLENKCKHCMDCGACKENTCKEPDFQRAREHLDRVEKTYTEIGKACEYGLVTTIKPLRERVNSGEVSIQLYDEIMEIGEKK